MSLVRKDSVADRVKKFKDTNTMITTPRVSANLHRHQNNILRLSTNLADIVKNASSEEKIDTVRISRDEKNKENSVSVENFPSSASYNSVEDIVSLLRSRAVESVASVSSSDENVPKTLLAIRSKSIDSLTSSPTNARIIEKYADISVPAVPPRDNYEDFLQDLVDEDPSEIITRIQKRLNQECEEERTVVNVPVTAVVPTRECEVFKSAHVELIPPPRRLELKQHPPSLCESFHSVKPEKFSLVTSTLELVHQEGERKVYLPRPPEVPCQVTCSDWRQIVESEIARTRASILCRIKNSSYFLLSFALSSSNTDLYNINMRIVFGIFVAIIAVVDGHTHKHRHHHINELVDPVIPTLTERQRKSLMRFEKPGAFESAWNVAKRKVHERIEKLNRRKHSRHNQAHSYLEDSGEDLEY